MVSQVVSALALLLTAQQPTAPVDSCVAAAPDVPPRVLALAGPKYPDSLKARGIVGTVQVDVEVTCDGLAERSTVRVVSSPHTALEPLAWDAVAYGVFQPGSKGGRVVRAVLRVPVMFARAESRDDVLIKKGQIPANVLTEAVVDQRPELVAFGRLVYPESLRLARVTGSVVLEFILDTLGHPEPDSYRIVSSPEPAMSAAAIRAAQEAQYRPARVGGRAVRVLVNQPINFTIPRP